MIRSSFWSLKSACLPDLQMNAILQRYASGADMLAAAALCLLRQTSASVPSGKAKDY